MAILKAASVDRSLCPPRAPVVDEARGARPPESRLWRLWQVETSFACNLKCVMCPWKDIREQAGDGLMEARIWAALRPHLSNVMEIDFSGGGEPLLHPNLAD